MTPADQHTNALQHSPYIKRLIASVLLINLFVAALAYYFLHQNRAQDEQQAEARTRNLSQVLALNISGAIDKTNLILLSVTDEIEQQLTGNRIENLSLESYISLQRERLPELYRLIVINAEGELVSGATGTKTSQSNFADRDYFFRLRDNADEKLVIGKPVFGIIGGKWVQVFSRRINNPDGSFAGVVAGSIKIDSYLNLFSSVSLGEHASITLRDKDLAIVARYPVTKEAGSAVGQKTVSKEFRSLIESGKQSATFKATYPVDKIERVYSFNKISGYPLYITVGVAPGDFLADWRREVLWVSGVTSIFILLTSILSWLLIKKWQQEKQYENTLKESEFFFRESQRSAAIGSYKTDFSTGYWESSEVLDSIFGISMDYNRTVQGWLDIIHPDDRDSMSHYLKEEVIANRKPFSREYRIIRKNDGKTRWVSGLGEAGFDNNGRILSLIGTIQDITSYKRMEKERLDLEKNLAHSQRLESLGVLAGGIAHDFNNILSVIIGYCSLVKLKPQTAENHISKIEKAAESAAVLCRQMLAYAGKTQMVQSSINMTALLNEMVNMLKATIRQNTAISFDSSQEIPFIRGDDSQLRQIVMNLIINASEAIGDAQGEIRISLTKAAIDERRADKDHLDNAIQPGSYVCLEVADNGCGMNDETRQRMFEPFYTTKFTGRGLGMSATLGIITAHNGALQLFSQPGQGTTIRVYLPVEILKSTGDAFQQPVASLPWKGKGTILLVEDDGQVMLIAKAMLSELGFTVIEASNGREALELYQQNTGDITLVVTDLGMPVMDGYELFRELKKLNPGLPVIITTGFGDDDVTSRLPREDIAGLIAKPYNFDKLREMLKSVVPI